MNRNKYAAAMLAASIDDVPLYLRPKLYAAAGTSISGPTEICHDLRRLVTKLAPPRKRLLEDSCIRVEERICNV